MNSYFSRERRYERSDSEGDPSSEYDSGPTYESEEEEDPHDRYNWPFESIGAPTDVLVPKGEDFKKMSELLGKVGQTEGLYSFGGKATTLPGLPGLRIKDVGDVSLPLRHENAGPLEAVGSRVRDNLWLFPPTQVEMNNPEWAGGIQVLSKVAGYLMGFKGVALSPVLTMLLLYGPGGRLDKQRAVDPTGRSVATMVVQLPSVFTGGRLVVRDESGLKVFRYDLGKEGGSAEYEPNYVVYATGAHRTVEEVKSGYRFVVTYSLCLPPELPAFSGRSAGYLLQVQLAEVVKKMSAVRDGLKEEGGAQPIHKESDILALMLSDSCSTEGIETKGTGSLTGSDGDRVHTLLAANQLLPPEKQLKFYLASLRHKKTSYWSARVEESIMWYSMSGSKLGENSDSFVEWTTKFNFLNPSGETLDQLWRCTGIYGYNTHKRFAIVAWPACADVKHAFCWIGETQAVTAVLSDNPVQLSKLRMLLQCETDQLATKANKDSTTHGYPYQYDYAQRSIQKSDELVMPSALCEKICKAVVEAGDISLVEAFLKTFFARLKEKQALLPWIGNLIRTFTWNAVGASIKTAVVQLPCSSRLNFVLSLVDSLQDDLSARKSLTTIAIETARVWNGENPSSFAISDEVCLLWKHVMTCTRSDILQDMKNLYLSMDGKLLLPVVHKISHMVAASSSQAQRTAFTSIISRCRQWLAAEIVEIEKPFTCQILNFQFPNAPEILAFFNGSNGSCVIRGLTGIAEARCRVELLQRKVKGQFAMSAEGRGRDALVRIQKIGGTFDPRRPKLSGYLEEIARLDQLVCALLPGNKLVCTAESSVGGLAKLAGAAKIPSALPCTAANSTTGNPFGGHGRRKVVITGAAPMTLKADQLQQQSNSFRGLCLQKY